MLLLAINFLILFLQPNLNSTIIKKTKFPFPPLKEQEKIIQEIESRLSVCDKIEETIENSLLQAEALRLSIIKKAFEQDYNNTFTDEATVVEKSGIKIFRGRR